MSDELVGLEEGISEAASELHIWRSLMEHPGWVLMEKELKVEETMRALVVTRKRLGSIGEVFSQEYMKGEANGLGFALSFPSAKLEELQSEVKKLNFMLERAKDVQKTAAPDESGRVPSDDGSLPSPSSSGG